MKRQQTTRQDLIAAADELFYRQGIRPVSVDAIAEKAGVTKKTLYYHFASKDDLIEAYLESRNTPTLGLYQEVARDGGELAEDAVARIFERLRKNAQRPHWRGCSFLRAASEFAHLRGHPATVIASRHKKAFEAWLKDILKADGVLNPQMVARQVMILFDGAVAQILVHGEPSYALAARDAAVLIIRAAKPSRS